jgi:signal-transduction protein with cAMP-binding, CBS, and nucleotidyltransferase domain
MPTDRTAVFRRLVRDHMAPPPVVTSPGTAVAAVVERVAAAGASAALVVDGSGRIQGILTERDVTRRVACRGGMDGAAVEQVMTRPVLTVQVDQHLYEAIGFMRRHRLRHMPVVDEDGALAGMLHLHDALAVAAGTMVDDIDRLTHEDSFAGLAEVKAAQVQLAEHLVADEVPAPEIQALISAINNDLHRRVLRLCVAELAGEGRGEPPVPFACIVMGSGGRGESFLFPDQDNGFVLADYPDEAHGEIDLWFVELAVRMTTALDGLRFPLCRGGVMATNPLWRKTLPQWRQQVTLWMRRRAPATLLACDIFFDFRCVHGDCGLADALRAFVTDAVPRDRGFLHELFAIQADHHAGIGAFGRLRIERADPRHRGHLNLKLQGTLPLAEAVRLLALAHGVAATGTLARTDALAERGVLGKDDADHLRGAFALLTGLQLRQQIADHRAGRPVGNWIDPSALTERELGLLKDSLRTVNEFRARLRAELTGALL